MPDLSGKFCKVRIRMTVRTAINPDSTSIRVFGELLSYNVGGAGGNAGIILHSISFHCASISSSHCEMLEINA